MDDDGEQTDAALQWVLDPLGIHLVPPAPPPARAGLHALARFGAAAGSLPTLLASVDLKAVTRISGGRYRVSFQTSLPDDQYTAICGVEDPAPRLVRVTARNVSWVEVRSTDHLGVPQDAKEISVSVYRVI